jgi:hypothetical protein
LEPRSSARKSGAALPEKLRAPRRNPRRRQRPSRQSTTR